jgi:DNA-binding IclR family transcriptional regulator
MVLMFAMRTRSGSARRADSEARPWRGVRSGADLTETKVPNERRDGIQVVARVASLLRVLSANNEGLSPQEIADKCDIPRPTVYRLVKALAAEEFVRTLPSGRILIGSGLMRVVIANTRDIRHDMRPFLEQLAREIDGHTEEAVLYAGEALFVDQYIKRRVMRAVTNVGTRGPIHCSANGKALLASLSPAEMEDAFPSELVRMTENTITDRDALRVEIAEVRRTGLAYDMEEYTLGVCACAAFVRGLMGDVVSIGAVVTKEHWDANHERVKAAVVHARDAARAALGGPDSLR